MLEKILLDGESLSAERVYSLSKLALNPEAKFKIEIAPKAREKILKAENFVSEIVKKGKPVYGINTGFGKFSEVSISSDQLSQLQTNLIRSHAAGVGEPLSRDIVFMMWILRLNTLCRGHSGVRLSTMDFVIRLLENGVLAQIPSRGSVGASGDLAPSAHASLILLGEGLCTLPHAGSFVEVPALKALENLGLAPLELAPKEGLGLINGTQLTVALALKVWAEGKKLLATANLAVSLTIEGMSASHKIAFEQIAKSKNQRGVEKCAEEIRSWLSGKSEIADNHANCAKVQDAYSLRCAPQVHGVVWDELAHAEEILNREMNSSNDNPLLFVEDGLSLSGGNFHALYGARVSDTLAASLTILSSISERRTAQMMSHASSGLPAFLVKAGGLNSGLMMAHVTAAALVSESKSLSMPASVDTIPTSDDREDHVSMGPGAGFKALQILSNTQKVLSIEILSAYQAVQLLRPLKTSARLEKVIQEIYRSPVAPLDADRVLSTDIQKIEGLVEEKRMLNL
jgi:histidine ammonia-lyase